MSNRFTPSAEQALNQSLTLARALGHTYIGTEHLLLGLLQEKDCIAARILALCGITYGKIHDALLAMVGSGIPTKIRPDDLTPHAGRVIEHAAYNAMKAGLGYIGTEHLLFGILEEEDCCAMRLLKLSSIDAALIHEHAVRLIHPFGPSEPAPLSADAHPEAGIPSPADSPASSRPPKPSPYLRRYTLDLCAAAQQGKFSCPVGREKETEQLLRILCRKEKNNPCLIGEPGVGKTALVEGLAAMIVKNRVPPLLRGRRLLALDLPAMIAGAKYRGEFEDRMKNLMNEVRTANEVILFIDEIHTLVGAGGAEGAIDAANILKPALARGEIRVIGATTPEEYRTHMEKDSALERRFQPLYLHEPSEAQALTMLRAVKPRLEKHHGIAIPDAMLSEAISLSVRYIGDRFLPDKAIDLLDECGAAMRLAGEAGLMDRRILAQVLSEQTGIPIACRACEEALRLRDAEKYLSSSVIGQEDAVSCVARALRRSSIGLSSPDRPRASFLFLGPSGVGKTEMARAITSLLFENERALLRFDMTEYSEPHSIARLLGSPPGYIGHEQGGQLTKAVRQMPYAVILFDEFEKAHPDLYPLFLQLLEEGRLSDARGRQVNFRNTILIFTASADLLGTGRVGFLASPKASSPYAEDRREEMRKALSARLQTHFRPELLGRIDEIVVFSRLSEQALCGIAERMLAELSERAEKLGIPFHAEDAVLAPALAAEARDSEEGARLLRRLIRSKVEDTLAASVMQEEEAALAVQTKTVR